MLWAAPAVSVDVVQVAIPAPLMATLAQTVAAPSVKLMVPVGVPRPGGVTLTVAVNVTDWPETEGLVPEASAVVVAALFTT